MATINVQDLATELNTTPRVARKFLRSVTPAEEQPGKGKRWSIEKRQVRSLKKQFAEFDTEVTAAAPTDPTPSDDSSPIESDD